MGHSRDYEELFKSLNAHRVRYLVVGAHAVMHYTEPRFTKDIDVWIPPALNDPRIVYRALADYGGPLRNVKPEDFGDEKAIFQMGVAPVRIDVMFGVAGVAARRAWRNRVRSFYGRTRINVLGRRDLVRAKTASGRPQDMLDLQRLRRSG